MLKKQLQLDLEAAIKFLGYPTDDIVLSIPKNSSFGDYSTNIALQLAKLKSVKAKQTPMEIAKRILSNLSDLNYLSKAEIGGDGFINFFIKDEVLIKNLLPVDTSPKIPSKKIMVEFAHPNTHKAFHIGHLRNISIGESVVRLLEAVGYQVIRANYQGDVGMHIAKAIYALLHLSPFKESVKEVSGLAARVELLGKAYAVGSKAFEEDTEAQKRIKDINFLVYASAQRFWGEKGVKPSSTDYLKLVGDRLEEVEDVYNLWTETRQWSLDYFDIIYRRVYTCYDRYFFESECLTGADLAREGIKKGILKENDGAVIFDGKEYGLDTRVFINNLGLPTYEAKELALAEKETSEFGNLDKIIHVVGPEQASFFKVTFKVEELLDPQRYHHIQYHLIYGWVKLKHGKMSSRLGEVVLGEWLLDEAKSKIKKDFPEMDDQTLEMVGVGAVKYSMLKFSTSSEITFSFDESISLQGDSGPYLQYTCARAKSVLRSVSYNYKVAPVPKELEQEERELLRVAEYFESIVEEAAANFAPNIVAGYLTNLAKVFNLFYQKYRIANAGEKTDFRLALTYAIAEALKQGLYLLGIEVPEKM